MVLKHLRETRHQLRRRGIKGKGRIVTSFGTLLRLLLFTLEYSRKQSTSTTRKRFITTATTAIVAKVWSKVGEPRDGPKGLVRGRKEGIIAAAGVQQLRHIRCARRIKAQ